MKKLMGGDDSAQKAAEKARKEAEARRRELELQQANEQTASRLRYRGVASLLTGGMTGYPGPGTGADTLG